jgi:hypothetical protein
VDTAPVDASASDLLFTIQRLERMDPGCSPADDGTGCTTIVLEYPEVSGAAPAAEPIRRWIAARILAILGEDAPVESAEALVEGFLAENRAFREEFSDAPGAWAVERIVTVAFQHPRVLTLSATDYSNTGGAHPLMVEILGSFDLEKGQLVMLSDLLNPGYSEALARLVEGELKRVRGLDPETDLVAEGFFLEDGFRVTENFAVLEDGLRFYYNPYEIGPYVLGPTDLTIPYTALTEWLPEDGLLAALSR